MSAAQHPSVQKPRVRVIGDLFAHSPLFAKTYLVYNLPASAIVKRVWPTLAQKRARDKFWAKFSA